MQVKRYEVSNISDALIKIKEDLGPDAIIISTKKIKGSKNSQIEVMAARDERIVSKENIFVNSLPVKSKPLTGNNTDSKSIHQEIKELKEIIRQSQKENSLGRELEELKETMDKFFDILGVRKSKTNLDVNQKLYYYLLANGFSRVSACRIIEAVNQQTSNQNQFNEEVAMKLVESYIIKSMPLPVKFKVEKRIKAFVGATGVGKTTTLAKLAARYALIDKKNVGLVSTDTFRIAASEQLKTYANIMGIKMEVASTGESLQKALQHFADKDIILIDTPGKGHVDDNYVSILNELLQRHHTETNLLISATASEENMQDTVMKYAAFGYDNLIVTKIDESRRLGILYDIISKSGKPVKYLTCGQNVPQDIEDATPEKMANLIMGNSIN
jgi:flagellar biosynthesis protein FlhF